MFNPHDGAERRKDPAGPLLEAINQLHAMVVALDSKVTAHVSDHRSDTAEILKEAFPEGDADGHRRHHEAVIKAAEEKAEFWRTMKKELAKWGLIMFVGWASYQLWVAFIHGPKP